MGADMETQNARPLLDPVRRSALPYPRFLTFARIACAVLGAATLAGTVRVGAQTPPEVPPAQPAVQPAQPEAATAPRLPVPKEVRGVWVVRTDLTSPQAVSRVVRHARANGLNTLFVQCRGRGDAYYNTQLEPRAQALEKQPISFDPLEQVVREGHAAGLQVHAWINSCYVWSDKYAPHSPQHLVNAHKDWLAVTPSGHRCSVGDSEVFICPGNPASRAHLVAVCTDIVHRYNVDGVQLDYIRYSKENPCYCDGCLQRFRDYLAAGRTSPDKVAAVRATSRAALPHAFAGFWGEFRRSQITSLVQDIHDSIKAERKSVLLSAAVIPWGRFPGDFTRSEAYNTVAQDWYGWMRTGLVDAVCPMTYQPSLPGFMTWVRGVQRDHPNFPVWYGIGAYLFGPDSAAAKIKAVRGVGGKGWVLFSYTAVTRGGANDNYLRMLKARVIPATTARGSNP